ncbi:hypothetical protein GJ697_03325 [Pseudoduganella sp. FT25W]|jgi:hypothetical protein|uniref:Uncharacterized protein n=1 Tax=Duganella alba TaxID=2666081 RepID=A0A6L5QCP5_9BURK|nr:hypothetical protein [Duganella alba]MRX06861.1 hypothetical protein [Duganella alba]MRX16242.1 hypothetical protein [Duganella alba]
MIKSDCLSSNIVFCVWAGNNAMSGDRISSLFTIFNNVHCPFVYLTNSHYPEWEVPEAPFHPAFQYLSDTHKADYLRVYMMHHFGGGYTDIKFTTKNWTPFFEALQNSDKWCLGYTEVGPHGVAAVGGELEQVLRANYQDLIGLCAFIFRKHTPLTEAWITRTHALLDSKYEDLKRHPARHPQDQLGVSFTDGTVSAYPIRWTELLGDIFHPLIYEFREHVLHADIAPSFAHKYR